MAFTPNQKIGAGGLAAGLLLALKLLMPAESEQRHAYLDITGTPTICYGETSGVSLGQVATDQQCRSMLSADLKPRVDAMQACTSAPVSPQVAAAMIDFGYNAGVGAYCQHPAKLINAGETRAACEWLGTHYTTSKGQRLRGLVNRRAKERALCLQGV